MEEESPGWAGNNNSWGQSSAPKSWAPKENLCLEPALLRGEAALPAVQFSCATSPHSILLLEKRVFVSSQVLDAKTVHSCFICLFSAAKGYECLRLFFQFNAKILKIPEVCLYADVLQITAYLCLFYNSGIIAVETSQSRGELWAHFLVLLLLMSLAISPCASVKTVLSQFFGCRGFSSNQLPSQQHVSGLLTGLSL